MAALNPLNSLNSLLSEQTSSSGSSGAGASGGGGGDGSGGTGGGGSGGGGAAAMEEEEEPLATLDSVAELDDPVVVVSGATAWHLLGDVKQSAQVKQSALYGPHRLLAGFGSVKVQQVVTGPAAHHTIALTDGGVFTWGRNHKGQLGHGDDTTRFAPERIASGLSGHIVSASAGKAHTVFVADSGAVFACGDNKFGAVGPGAKKKAETAPSPIPVPGMGHAVRVSCGTDFSLVLDDRGSVWSFGWSEYGQLGLGTDGSYNKAEGSVKITYEAERNPSRVPVLNKVVQIACGTHHSVALTECGTAYTWGSGGYGRLGHQNQEDVWAPKPLPNIVFRSVAAGNAWSCGVGWPVYQGRARPSGSGMLHMWGRVNPGKDAWMYPKPEYELQGWNINAMSCGFQHSALSADGSVIVWGSGCQFGELGFGPTGPKSSARPRKVDLLEGANIVQTACGYSHTAYLAQADDLINALPEYEPPPPEPASGAAEEGAGKGKGKGKGTKRGAPAAKGKAAKKKK